MLGHWTSSDLFEILTCSLVSGIKPKLSAPFLSCVETCKEYLKVIIINLKFYSQWITVNH
jgi:hypothetical protein